MATTGPNHGEASSSNQCTSIKHSTDPLTGRGLPFEIFTRNLLSSAETDVPVLVVPSSQDIEAIHQAMPFEVGTTFSDEDHPKERTTFSDLPPELRNMIWHEALAPRIVIIYPHNGAAETDSPNEVDWNKIPGMLFANRESRLIAEYHYDQQFTLTFTNMRGVCRIPVIMSAVDVLAFSASSLSARFGARPFTNISVEAVHGASELCIDRISLLGDKLMREGTNQEYLTELFKPDSPVWEGPDNLNGGTIFPWIKRWRPFSGKQSDLETAGPDLKGVEDIVIQRELVSGACYIEDWLWVTFNCSFVRASKDEIKQGLVDAWVSERPLRVAADSD